MRLAASSPTPLNELPVGEKALLVAVPLVPMLMYYWIFHGFSTLWLLRTLDRPRIPRRV